MPWTPAIPSLKTTTKGKINAPGGTQKHWENKHKTMIESLFAQGQIKVELPYASQNQLDKHEKPSIITIDEQNIIYFNDKVTDMESLKNEISAIDNKTLIQLKSDKNAKFETFVQVVDILKEKGHENFGISTKSK